MKMYQENIKALEEPKQFFFKKRAKLEDILPDFRLIMKLQKQRQYGHQHKDRYIDQ